MIKVSLTIFSLTADFNCVHRILSKKYTMEGIHSGIRETPFKAIFGELVLVFYNMFWIDNIFLIVTYLSPFRSNILDISLSVDFRTFRIQWKLVFHNEEDLKNSLSLLSEFCQNLYWKIRKKKNNDYETDFFLFVTD